MNKRFGAIPILVAAVAAAAGLFASPSRSSSSVCARAPSVAPGCLVSLTGTGPSPSRLEMPAGRALFFGNPDSVSHTVVFANGRCSLTLTPGEGLFPGPAVSPDGDCRDPSSFYVGSYAYTVDGKFPGTVVITPLRRSVTLTARTHTIRGGKRLTLHGQLWRNDQGARLLATLPVPVTVLARENNKQPFEPMATTVRARFIQADATSGKLTYGWKLNVQPHVTTTYIARVTTQRLCEFPVARCAHPHGQVWANATSGPFTVRIRHEEPR